MTPVISNDKDSNIFWSPIVIYPKAPQQISLTLQLLTLSTLLEQPIPNVPTVSFLSSGSLTHILSHTVTSLP